MQEQQPYRQFGKETATFIVELVNNQSGGYEFLEFRDDGHTPGVYVSETYIGLFPSGGEGIEAGNVFEWNPACDTEDDTDPEAAPLLPVPFTAKELAAFLLYGVGNYIQERLGRIGQLDEDQLSKLGGVRKKLPRQALRAAYVEAERAQQIVGLPDIEAQELAYSLAEQLDEAEREENHSQGVFARDISPEEASRRRALVVESLADLRKRTQIAKSEAAAKAAQWRGAMVRQLLEPLPQTPEQPVSAGANREELARLRAEAEARRQEDERKAAEGRAAEEARLATERAEIAKQREEQEAKALAERAELERQTAELRAQQEVVRKQQEAVAAETKRLEDERIAAEEAIEADAHRIEPEQHQGAPVAEPQSTTGRQSQINDQREENVSSWKDRVRSLADEEHRKAKAAGYDLTKQQIAEKVAAVAEKMGIRGAYAKLTPANVLREALQGDRWKRPTD